MSEIYPVTVVIPAHNAVRTVERSIDSAFAAGAGQVVVVDDASADGTAELIESLRDVYPSSQYDQFYKPLHTGKCTPAGVCHARNLGVSEARCGVAIPLDADDMFTSDGIRLLFETYINSIDLKNLNRTLVYGGHIRGDTGEVVAAPLPHRLAQKNLTGATFAFSVLDWGRAGGYHPDFNLGCEDWAFMAALVSAGVQLVRVEEPVYIYSSGGQRAARCLQYADTLRQLLREHYPVVFNAQQSH